MEFVTREEMTMKRFLLILCAFMLMTGGALAEDRRDEAHRYSGVGPVYEGFTWAAVSSDEYGVSFDEAYMIDVHGNRLTDDTCTISNRYFHQGLVTVWKDGQAGCIDRSGSVAIPFEFHDIYEFTELGLACASLKERWDTEKWGVIDRQGQWVIPAAWDHLDFLDPGEGFDPLVNMWQGRLSGLMTLSGETVLPCEYSLSYFAGYHDGRLQVKQDGAGYGYVNELGQLVIPCQWTYGGVFSEGLARVLDGMKSGYIDPDGHLVISRPDGWIARGDFHEGLALVENDQGLYGYIDQTGALAIPFQWEKADSFSEGMAQVWQDGKCGFVNTAGEIIIPCRWKDARTAQEGHIVVQDESGLWGMTDLAGNLTVPCAYKEIDSIEQQVYQMANVIDGRTLYGLIGADGTVICPCCWSLMSSSATEGIVQVCLGYTRMADYDAWNGQESTTGFISLTGEIIVPCEYDHGYYRNGYFTLIQDGYLTILDKDGNLVF